MFYAALILNFIFLIFFLGRIIPEQLASGASPTFRGFFRILLMTSGPLAGITGLIFTSSWLTVLGIAGYGIYAWESLFSWIMPSLSFMNIFTFGNLISGRTAEILKNMPKEQFTPVRKKITRADVLLWLLALITFTVMLIYYGSVYPS